MKPWSLLLSMTIHSILGPDNSYLADPTAHDCFRNLRLPILVQWEKKARRKERGYSRLFPFVLWLANAWRMAGRSLLLLPRPAAPAFKLFSPGLLSWSISSLNEKISHGALHWSSEDQVSRPEIVSLGCEWRSLCVVRWFITVWLRSRFRKSSHTYIVVQPDFLFCRGAGSAAWERLKTVNRLFFLLFTIAVVCLYEMHRTAFIFRRSQVKI